MEAEITQPQPSTTQQQVQKPVSKSVCKTIEDRERLLKLFELLHDIDKKLKSKSNENNKRSSNNPDKTK